MNDDALRVNSTAAPVREQVARVLREAISSERFKPGERLIERQLCELTNVSRTSVREALRLLESEGLVSNIPNQGPIVAIVTDQQARDIYQVRAVLEGLAGELFAERASDEQRERLTASAARMETILDSHVELLEEKDGFYRILLEGAGNEVAAMMLNSLNTRIAILRRTTLSQPDRPKQMLAELRDMLAAIEARDPQAARAASLRHVQSAAAVASHALSHDEVPDATT